MKALTPLRHRSLLRLLCALAAVLGLLLSARTASAQSCPDAQTFNLSASATAGPSRLFRDTIPSTCSAPKTFPGNAFGPAPLKYAIRSYQNVGAATCVQVTYSSVSSPTFCAFAGAYQGGQYDPANLATGYIADSGSSADPTAPPIPPSLTNPPNVTFSFNVAASSSFDLVFQEVFDGLTTCNVTYTISGCNSPVKIDPTGAMVRPGEARDFTALGGSGFVFSLAANQSGGSITPAGNYVAGPLGDTTDVVKVTNAGGASATAIVSVSGNLKIAPLAGTVAPNGALSFTASAGSGGYTFSLATNESGGMISAAGNYVAGPNGETTDTIKVTDAAGATATARVSVTASVQISPWVAATYPTMTRNFTATGGTAPYTFSLAVNGSGGRIGSSGQYTAGAKGSVTDVVRVTDATGLTATATVQVHPGLVVSPASASVPPRGTIQFSSSGGGSDPIWSLEKNASGGSIDRSGAYKAGTGTHVVDVVRATLPSGAFVSVNVSVTAGVGLVPDAATVAPLGTVTFVAAGGSKVFTFTLLANPSGGSVDGSGVYKAGAIGNVVDQLEVKDSAGNRRIAEITVGAPLSLTPGDQTVKSGETIAFAIAGGSGNYTAKIEPNASGATVDAGGRYVAGPNAGKDTIVVTDSNGATATAVVTVERAKETQGTPLPSPSTSSSSSTSGSASSSSSSGAATASSSAAEDDSGCNTTSSSTTSPFAFLAVAAAFLLSRRSRRRDS